MLAGYQSLIEAKLFKMPQIILRVPKRFLSLERVVQINESEQTGCILLILCSIT